MPRASINTKLKIRGVNMLPEADGLRAIPSRAEAAALP